ncbi:ATP-binding protein [Afipia sp. P52-10]|uniref:ATP-binding protein n=1 Tax=Afipia sp. P52-10 TaxID=1429916 RepID=UPI003907E846
MCRADPARLEAALLNLIVNARDALGERHGSIRISTKGCDEPVLAQDGLEAGKFVCLSVRDDGPGMPKEILRRAMEPFFTTKGDRGTGLGLSQVHAFMREMGGDMMIESEVGVGTAINLLLPRAERSALTERLSWPTTTRRSLLVHGGRRLRRADLPFFWYTRSAIPRRRGVAFRSLCAPTSGFRTIAQ